MSKLLLTLEAALALDRETDEAALRRGFLHADPTQEVTDSVLLRWLKPYICNRSASFAAPEPLSQIRFRVIKETGQILGHHLSEKLPANIKDAIVVEIDISPLERTSERKRGIGRGL